MQRLLPLCCLAFQLMGCSTSRERTSYEDLVKACTIHTACGLRAYPRVSSCVEGYDNLALVFGFGPIYDGIYRCVIGANGDCAKVGECFAKDRAYESCDTSFQAECDGAHAISCSTIDRHIEVFDCSLAGLGCALRQPNTFEALCSPGTCDAANFQPHCEENRLLTCEQGLIAIEDCGVKNQSCDPSSSNGSACVGNQDETCSPGSFSQVCDGDSALDCVGGRIHKINCSDLPYASRCKDGLCVGAGTACTSELDRCKGDQLETCYNGSWMTIDCRDLGLGPCAPSSSGAACSME